MFTSTMRYFVLCCFRFKYFVVMIFTLTCFALYRELLSSHKTRYSEYGLRSYHNKLLNSQVSSEKKLLSLPVPVTHNSTHFILGHFLNSEVPQNESFCNFNYGMAETFNWTDMQVSYSPELGNASPYRVIYNVIEVADDKEIGITYCTHATPEFLYNIVEIVRRWEGPISVAVFAPGTDAALSFAILYRLCHCLPEMSRVSVHIIFPVVHPPTFLSILNLHSNFYNKSKFQELIFLNCSIPEKLINGEHETFRQEESLTYPVNVGRNVARVGAKTSRVLVSDIELLPSFGLVPAFLSMLSRFQTRSGDTNPSFLIRESRLNNYVYVLPVFEVDATVTNVPRTKAELLELYAQNRAVYFHRWVCLHCQRFPGLQRWLQRKPVIVDGGAPVIQPLLVVRREFPYHRWEPVYIGTNRDPLYSELLTWEGQQDKMTQMSEMCLLGYRFIILDGAFLVHTPGMKHRADVSAARMAWRRPHERHNIQLYKNIIRDMMHKYESKKRCNV